MNMRWIVSFTLIIIIFGTVFGLILGGLNPWTNPAKANRMNIETAHKQAVYQLQEQLARARTEAEIQEIQRQQALLDAQYQHDIQALNQDLAHRETAFKTWMAVLTNVGGALSITLVISTTMWVGSKALTDVRSHSLNEKPVKKVVPPVEKTIQPLPERKPYDPWSSPVYRYEKRIAAQQEERKEREEIAARMMSFRDPGRISTEEYHKSPQAN